MCIAAEGDGLTAFFTPPADDLGVERYGPVSGPPSVGDGGGRGRRGPHESLSSVTITLVETGPGELRLGSQRLNHDAAQRADRRFPVAKGQEKSDKNNKPKLSTKEKQAKKAQKKVAAV